jgi:hypothetical protein
VIVVIIVLCKCCRGKGKCGSKPGLSNEAFVKSSMPKKLDGTVEDFSFQSGAWSFRYNNNGIWNAPSIMSLRFDQNASTVVGSGTDVYGSYTIDGVFSSSNHRLALKKTYDSVAATSTIIAGTQSIAQLVWNSTEKKFVGKWYDNTNHVAINGDCELTLSTSQSDAFKNIY